MDETTFTVTVTAILLVLMFAGILIGRRSRTKRQQSFVAAPTEVPAQLLQQQPEAVVEGTYVSTVLGKDLLERVTAHRLGNPAETQIEVHATGVVLLRAVEPNIFIPAADITAITTVSGIAGKFVEKDGIVAITWQLGDTEVTTGLRIETITDHRQLLTALEPLINGRQTA